MSEPRCFLVWQKGEEMRMMRWGSGWGRGVEMEVEMGMGMGIGMGAMGGRGEEVGGGVQELGGAALVCWH